MKLAVLLFVILIAACAPAASQSLTAQQNLNAAQVQATNAALNDQSVQQATAQADRQAQQRASRATEAAQSATAQAVDSTEQARQAIARATEQARADASSQLTLEQQQIAATATRAALDRQMGIDAQIAQRTAAEAQATITAANEAAATAKQTSAYKNDLIYNLPDILMRYAPCGAVIFAMLLVGYIVRAIAARIAGDEGRAKMALANPSFTVYFPNALLPSPRDDDNENDDERPWETGNRATPGNTGNTEETGRETAGETPDLIDLGHNWNHKPTTSMSREEYHELLKVRREAIALLQRCVNYYREAQAADDGTIPRYDKIHMKSEDRGRIVDNLWYSQYVIKSPNQTTVDPAYYTTCNALMQAIINKWARIYPMGYHERKQERLDAAVAALPGVSR